MLSDVYCSGELKYMLLFSCVVMRFRSDCVFYDKNRKIDVVRSVGSFCGTSVTKSNNGVMNVITRSVFHSGNLQISTFK
jgi:hypothetical protein